MSSFTSRIDYFIPYLIAFLPISVFAGKAVIDITLSLIALIFLVRCVIEKDGSFLKQRWFQAAALFWLYMILRSALAEYPDKGISTSIPWIRFAVFTAALAYWCQSKKIRDWFMNALLATIGFVLINLFAQYMTGYDLFGHTPRIEGTAIRLSAITGNLNTGILTSWLALPLLTFCALKSYASTTPLWQRVLYAFTILASIVGIYITGERMAFLSLMLGITIMLCLLFVSRYRTLALSLAGLAIVLVIGLYHGSTPLQTNIDRTVHVITDLENTSYGKIFANGLGIFEAYPVTGVGVRSFRFYCSEGGGDQAYLCDENGHNRFRHPHNIYVEILAELGAVGMILFLAIPLLIILSLLKHCPKPWLYPLLFSMIIAALLRIFPLGSTPNFYYAWSMASFWLWAGFALGAGKALGMKEK